MKHGLRGAAAVTAALDQMGSGATAEKGARRLARGIAARARERTPVKTGRLRRSLTVSGSGLRWQVGYTAEYAPEVEFGHRTANGGTVEGAHFLRDSLAQETACAAGGTEEETG